MTFLRMNGGSHRGIHHHTTTTDGEELAKRPHLPRFSDPEIQLDLEEYTPTCW